MMQTLTVPLVKDLSSPDKILTGEIHIPTRAFIRQIVKPRKDYYAEFSKEEFIKLQEGVRCSYISTDGKEVNLLDSSLKKGTYTIKVESDEDIPYLYVNLEPLHNPQLDIFSTVLRGLNDLKCEMDHCSSKTCVSLELHTSVTEQMKEDINALREERDNLYKKLLEAENYIDSME